MSAGTPSCLSLPSLPAACPSLAPIQRGRRTRGGHLQIGSRGRGSPLNTMSCSLCPLAVSLPPSLRAPPFRTLLSASSMGFLVLSFKDLTIVDCSPLFATWLGLDSPGHLVGRNFTELLCPGQTTGGRVSISPLLFSRSVSCCSHVLPMRSLPRALYFGFSPLGVAQVAHSTVLVCTGYASGCSPGRFSLQA